MLALGACRDLSVPAEPLLAPAQYDRIGDALGLTDAQQAAARDVYAGYRAEFDAARAKLQAYFERADRVREVTGDDERVQKAKARAREKFDAHSKALRARLLEDLQAVVTPAQMAKWPLVERRLRREELAEWGGLHGSGVDVAAVFESIERPGDRNPAVARALDDYEEAIDRPLLEGTKAKAAWEAREAKRTRTARRADGDGRDEAAERAALTAHLARLLELSQSMQRINLRAADDVEAALPQARAREFRRAFDRRAFGEMHAPTPFAALLDEIESLDDLTEAQRARIEALRSEYEAAAWEAGSRWARAVAAWEQSKHVDPDGAGGEEAEPAAVASAKAARHAVDARFRREAAGALTPAQLEKFPGLAGDERLGEIEF